MTRVPGLWSGSAIGADVVSVALRVGGAAGRFVLLFVLARYLTPSDVGVFGLVAAAVVLTVYALGLEYHTYTTRALLHDDAPRWGERLRAQAAVHLAAYGVALVVVVVTTAVGLLPPSLVGWASGIVLLDHASLELYRLLIVDRRPVAAHVVMFLRTGGWGLAWAASAVVFSQARSLEAVWVFWIAGSGLAVLVGAVLLWPVLRPIAGARAQRADIRRGLRTAGIFIVSSLAFRGVFVVDRYILEALSTTSDVGIYTFYIGLASGVLLVTESGAVVSRFPGLVAAHRGSDRGVFARHLREFGRRVGVAVAVAVLVAVVAIRPVLGLLDRPAYAANLELFWILLAAFAMLSLSLIPHYVLYAQARDLVVANAAAAGLVVAAGLALVLVPVWGMVGSAVATLSGAATVSAIKTVAALRGRRRTPEANTL